MLEILLQTIVLIWRPNKIHMHLDGWFTDIYLFLCSYSLFFIFEIVLFPEDLPQRLSKWMQMNSIKPTKATLISKKIKGESNKSILNTTRILIWKIFRNKRYNWRIILHAKMTLNWRILPCYLTTTKNWIHFQLLQIREGPT